MTLESEQKENDAMRKVVAAYIKSNLYFPQVRFGFVLCVLAGTQADQIDGILQLTSIEFHVDEISRIARAADVAHAKNGIVTVIPASPKRIAQEIDQSLKVLDRTVRTYKVLMGAHAGSLGACSEREIQKLCVAASELWSICVSSKYHMEHIRYVGTPTPTPIKIESSNLASHPLHRLHSMLSSMSLPLRQKYLLQALEAEMLHPLIVIR